MRTSLTLLSGDSCAYRYGSLLLLLLWLCLLRNLITLLLRNIRSDSRHSASRTHHTSGCIGHGHGRCRLIRLLLLSSHHIARSHRSHLLLLGTHHLIGHCAALCIWAGESGTTPLFATHHAIASHVVHWHATASATHSTHLVRSRRSSSSYLVDLGHSSAGYTHTRHAARRHVHRPLMLHHLWRRHHHRRVDSTHAAHWRLLLLLLLLLGPDTHRIHRHTHATFAETTLLRYLTSCFFLHLLHNLQKQCKQFIPRDPVQFGNNKCEEHVSEVKYSAPIKDYPILEFTTIGIALERDRQNERRFIDD